MRAARHAPVLVATSRELATLRRAAVQVDVLVGSGEDAAERFETGELEPEPGVVVTTAGHLGGWIRPGGPFRAAPIPGPVSDAYGCGDCFAAGLTYGLALGNPVDEAVALGGWGRRSRAAPRAYLTDAGLAQCGAAVLTGRGGAGTTGRYLTDPGDRSRLKRKVPPLDRWVIVG